MLLKGEKNIARCSVNPCIFNRAMNLTHHSTANVLHSHFSSLTFRLRLKGMGLEGVSSGIITGWTLTSCLSCYLSMWQSFPIKVSSSSSFFMKKFLVKITRLFGLWSIRIRIITNHLYLVPSATLEREKEDIRWELLSVFWHMLATASMWAWRAGQRSPTEEMAQARWEQIFL